MLKAACVMSISERKCNGIEGHRHKVVMFVTMVMPLATVVNHCPTLTKNSDQKPCNQKQELFLEAFMSSIDTSGAIPKIMYVTYNITCYLGNI